MLGSVPGLDVQIGRKETSWSQLWKHKIASEPARKWKGFGAPGSAQLCRDGPFHFLGIALAV